MAPISHSTALEEGERKFLQHRVSRFGFVAGLIFIGFWLFRVVQFTFSSRAGTPWSSGYLDPTMNWHFIGGCCLLAIWRSTAAGTPSVARIRAIEVVGLVLVAGAMSMMALHMPLAARPDYILLLALTSALMVRAIYVPSTWKRSLFLATAIGIEIMVATYALWLRIDVEAWSHVQPQMAEYTPASASRFLLFSLLPWWIVTAVTTTAASDVFYGLRRDVRKAKRLGQYKLESKIGEGGMGIVFKAHHALLRRPTAIKLLLPERAGERSIARFEREVVLMARLRHPNTVTVFDYGRSPDGLFYYAMEYVQGATLDDVVKHTGPMEPGRALNIVAQVAAAMVEAHGIGLIHRDIKPANIMLYLPHPYGGIDEAAKILDFGLVRQLSAEDTGITHQGQITGTPQYMAPESIRSPDDVDGRVDIYALGCVLFFLLTGEHVFTGATIMEVCAAHLHQTPDRMSARTHSEFPEAIEAIVAECLQKDPNARIGSARDLQARIAAIERREFTPREAQEWWDEHGQIFDNAADPPPQMLTLDLARILDD